jgi:hypothetical protein
MPTTRRAVKRERKAGITQDVLDAFIAGDEERLRHLLNLGPSDFTPYPNSASGYCINPETRTNIFRGNDLWPNALALFDQLSAAAKQYRAQNGIPEPKPKRVKRVAKRSKAK